MTSSTVCILATIFVYLVGMLVIGFHYAKKNESSTDFYLGGRKLGPLVTAMSAEASDMSSYLLMGLPGLAYLSGVADVGWWGRGGRARHRTCRRYISQLAFNCRQTSQIYP